MAAAVDLVSLTVHVNSLGGSLCTLDATVARTTVSALKSAIAEASGFEVDSFRLIHGTSLLTDSQSLEHLAVDGHLHVGLLRRSPRVLATLKAVPGWCPLPQKWRDFVQEHADDLQHRDCALAVVEKNGQSLEWLAKEYRGDRELVLAAIGSLPPAFQFVAVRNASWELCDDGDFMHAAMSQCRGYPSALLEIASRRLRGDRAFMLAVMHQYGGSLSEFATKELRRDRDFMLAAALTDVSGSFIVGERRVERCRFLLLTLQDFQSIYPTTWRQEWIASPVELRVARDGKEYQLRDFRSFYHNVSKAQAEWDAADIAVQRRIARDGREYAMEEFFDHYGLRWCEEWAAATRWMLGLPKQTAKGAGATLLKDWEAPRDSAALRSGLLSSSRSAMQSRGEIEDTDTERAAYLHRPREP